MNRRGTFIPSKALQNRQEEKVEMALIRYAILITYLIHGRPPKKKPPFFEHIFFEEVI